MIYISEGNIPFKLMSSSFRTLCLFQDDRFFVQLRSDKLNLCGAGRLAFLVWGGGDERVFLT